MFEHSTSTPRIILVVAGFILLVFSPRLIVWSVGFVAVRVIAVVVVALVVAVIIAVVVTIVVAIVVAIIVTVVVTVGLVSALIVPTILVATRLCSCVSVSLRRPLLTSWLRRRLVSHILNFLSLCLCLF